MDNTNKGAGTAPRNRTGRECLIVCLWGYTTYLSDHFTLAHHDRGGIHPTTIKKLITPERNRLTEEIIEASECLKNWWECGLI